MCGAVVGVGRGCCTCCCVVGAVLSVGAGAGRTAELRRRCCVVGAGAGVTSRMLLLLRRGAPSKVLVLVLCCVVVLGLCTLSQGCTAAIEVVLAPRARRLCVCVWVAEQRIHHVACLSMAPVVDA